jgi:hypothetical protein
MSATNKVAPIRPPSISPDLKSFLDEVLVPMLVRDALKEMASENILSPAALRVVDSRPTAHRSASEVKA